MHGADPHTADGARSRVAIDEGSRSIAVGEFRSLTRLALPIVVTQLSQMGMGIADTIMAGHVSAADLAGVALGGNLFWPVMMLLSGTVMAVTPSVAQLDGAGRQAEAGEVVRQALWLGVGGAVVFVIIYSQSEHLLRWAQVDPLAIPVAVGYLDAVRFGLVPVIGYFALRYLCEGMSWTTPAMLIALGALACKVPLNLLFIHGGYGISPLGGIGCGIATAILMTLELVAMVLVVLFSRMRAIRLFGQFSKPNRAEILRLARLGLPIGITLFFEMAVFTAVALLIGRLGVEALAAHQIALNINGVTFMIPLALGVAATIRVGFNVGAGDYHRARIAGRVAIGSSALFAVGAAIALLIGREGLTALFTADAGVASVAAKLLLFVAFYQIFDDGQTTAIGVLRGYKDTRVPLYVTLMAYWAIALPIGVVLGFGLALPALGVYGFWWGFTVGLGFVAVVLVTRVFWFGRSIERIRAFAAG